MKVFVTVGTSVFNGLFEFLDEYVHTTKHEIKGQIARGTYVPRNFPFFRFAPNIEEDIKSADVVVTHAGAGTVFRLLELRKPFIAVANLERVDDHQIELVRFVSQNGYALSTKVVEDLPNLLEEVQSFIPRRYEKVPFFLGREIAKELLS